MAASIKVSELNAFATLTSDDLFLVSDLATSSSRKVSYGVLKADVILGLQPQITALQNEITDLSAEIESRNLAAGLSLGYLYVTNFTGG